MTNSISPAQQELHAIIAEAEEQLGGLNNELASLDEKLDSLAGERQKYQLLDDICQSLDKLSEMDAADLFWGEGYDSLNSEQQLQHVRENVAEFQKRISVFDEEKISLQQQINNQLDHIDSLNDELIQLLEQEERAKYDFTIEREERALPFRAAVMPWTKQGDDERRYRKALLLVFLFVMAFSGLMNFWTLPEVDKNEPVEIPEHLVKLVKKQQPKPKPPVKKPQKKEEKKDEKKPSKQQPKPTPRETQVARAKAESTGVLAFKNSFQDMLADNDVSAKLGASASISNSGAKATGDSSRSLVMSQAASGSGGISASSVSRGLGGGGGAGKRLGGVGFSRVTTNIKGGGVGEGKPLSDGPGPSRTDEEIQIVFDRYKGTLYRIYNRELRTNPTLKGKMVLEITIQPDGSVSVAKVISSDLDSPTLSAKIAARVKQFNFGPKAGVPAVTIRYPIDFLPAT